jgi:uncharacterized membrane protein YeaQ/YmgE (transglycosylase-associated protein family)
LSLTAASPPASRADPASGEGPPDGELQASVVINPTTPRIRNAATAPSYAGAGYVSGSVKKKRLPLPRQPAAELGVGQLLCSPLFSAPRARKLRSATQRSSAIIQSTAKVDYPTLTDRDHAADCGRAARGSERKGFMTLATILLWMVIGLIAGWLASVVVGGGFGLVGDIIVGIVGSFIGSVIFHALHVSSPFGGIAGQILVAFVGAVVLLLILRLVRGRGSWYRTRV